MHRPLKGQDTVIGRTRIIEVIDKGAGKGALVLTEREITDKATGEPIATVTQTTFCRADGGFGGPPRAAPAPHELPSRAPDAVCDLATRPEAALIYRLSGDRNPLHADPAVAKQAGYPRPIMHGLGNFGIAGHAVLKTLCGYDPRKAGFVRLPFFRAGVSRRDAAHRDVARRRHRELPLARGRTRRDRRQ